MTIVGKKSATIRKRELLQQTTQFSERATYVEIVLREFVIG